MEVLVKRIYEPEEDEDGYRILADRLWPRGVSKENAKIDLWLKGIAPSKELRTWFHKDKTGRYKEFTKRYKTELKLLNKDVFTEIKQYKVITLITATRDIECSHIPTLKSFLERL